jgi:diguanylate cyclase (GGDEF)-like protein
MPEPIRLLILEESKEDLHLLLSEFAHGGVEVLHRCVQNQHDFVEALQQSNWEAIVANDQLTQFDGMSALKIAREFGEEPPFILVSSKNKENPAIWAMREGAQDFVHKENLKRLVPAVEREVQGARVRSERRRAQEMILHMTHYDALTDLPNRTLFTDILGKAIGMAQHTNESGAVFLISLFQFEEMGDALGQSFIDLISKQVADRLTSFFRECDTVARFTDNNFAIIAPSTNLKEAILVAQRIVDLFETSFIVQTVPIALSVHVGITIFPDHEEAPESLIQAGTIAMRKARMMGDDYVVYSPIYTKGASYHIQLMGELREGIRAEQLILYYQPKVNLATGEIHSVEALVRWQHPRHGFITPAEFIPSAEQNGMLRPVTAWNLETCIEQIRKWGPLAVPVSINLSAQDLRWHTLVDRVEKALQRTGISPRLLEFEVTEAAMITAQAKAKDILTNLSKMGIGIAIDDFGAGYTSLGLFQKLPIQAIKIDSTLIGGLKTDRSSRFTVLAIIDLAHHIGLSVIAEGVENIETNDLLIIGGCDFGQGYFFGYPMSSEAITSLLEKRQSKPELIS